MASRNQSGQKMKWYQMRWAQKYWGKDARERYRRYLLSDAWKAKRKAVLRAAGFRCRRCGARATEVHHETYKRIYKERITDLTALCRACHEAAHAAAPGGHRSRRHNTRRRSTQKRRPPKPKKRRMETSTSARKRKEQRTHPRTPKP